MMSLLISLGTITVLLSIMGAIASLAFIPLILVGGLIIAITAILIGIVLDILFL